MAELIRKGIAQAIASHQGIDHQSRIERAITTAGRFRSGVKDLAREHDRYFVEAVEDGLTKDKIESLIRLSCVS